MPSLMTKEEFEGKVKLIDFTKREEIVTLFPSYAQERYAIKRANKKNVSNAVNIEGFTMKTPFGDQTLLSGTTLLLEPQKRQALIGANSTGKTLLFHNMCEGKIRDFPKHLYVHHCKELESYELNDTVFNTVIKSHPFRNSLLRCQTEIQTLLNQTPAPTGDLKMALRDNLEYVEQQLVSLHGNNPEEKVIGDLNSLGFDEIGRTRMVKDLSGGLRMRVAICMAFFINADLLLLDEPTNHLDFPTVQWLENKLRGYRSSFLLVSHDREVLNKVCTSILLLEDKQIKYYSCGFKEFERRKH